MIKEPKRLLVSERGALADSLAASQLRLPSEARLAALAARLAGSGVALGEPARVPGAREFAHAPRQLPARPLELSLKVVLAALALGVVALGGALSWRYGTSRTAANSAAAPLSAAGVGSNVPVLAPARAAPRAARPALPEREPANGASAPRAEPARSDGTTPIATASGTEDAEPATLAARAVPAPARPLGGAPANPSSLAHAPSAAFGPKRTAPTTKDEHATSSGERLPLPANTVVDSEVEMLKKARNALSADPVQAFSLSERCRAHYPSGGFAQERDFIAISALIRLGRQDEARGRASLFRTRYRNSAYLPQLTRMLGEE